MAKEVDEILNLTKLPEILMTVTHQELIEILKPAMKSKIHQIEKLKDRIVQQKFKSLFKVNTPNFSDDISSQKHPLQVKKNPTCQNSFINLLEGFSLSIWNPASQATNLYFSFHDLFQTIMTFHQIQYDPAKIEQPAEGLKQYTKQLLRQEKNNYIKTIQTEKAPWQAYYYKDSLIKILCNLEEAYNQCHIPMEDEIKECLDPDKLGLFVVSKMMPWLTEIPEFGEKNMAYLTYVNKYYDHLMKQIEKDPKKKGMKVLSVTRDGIYDVPKFLEEYYQYCEDAILHEEQQETLFVDWEFLPAGKKKQKQTTEPNKKYLIHTSNKISLNEVVDRKIFFKQNEPVCAIRGKDQMKGYYGHIYPNGKIIFEKYYSNEEKGILASREATYVMDILYFEELSKWTKTELLVYMSKTPSHSVKRICHDKHWKEKLQQEINSPINTGREFQIKQKLNQIQFNIEKHAQLENLKNRSFTNNRSKSYTKKYNPVQIII